MPSRFKSLVRRALSTPCKIIAEILLVDLLLQLKLVELAGFLAQLVKPRIEPIQFGLEGFARPRGGGLVARRGQRRLLQILIDRIGASP